MTSRHARFLARSITLAACLLMNPVNATSVPTTASASTLPLEELRAFAEVLDRIRSAYVEQVDDRTLLENAIEGMLSRLDPHSSYLNEEAYRNLQEATSGEFGGVGLEIDQEDGLVRIVAPMDGTPAELAGLRPGDLIVRIDARPVRDMTLAEAVSAMRGEVGSVVELTIRRPGSVELMHFSLVRSLIEVPSVSARMLEPGFGYLRVAQFQHRTVGEFRRALAQLQNEAEGGLHGLILDLRNNPGGVLQASVAVADTFLESGRIVYTEGRLPSAQGSYSANGQDLGSGVPLIVLINEGSASAAEIVAGALQYHRRAVLLGTPSFGKGSVQTILPLSDDRAIKLTTALYFTPGGRSIQAQGIDPDIRVERGANTFGEFRSVRREIDLPRHLSGNGDSPPAPERDLISDDRQIIEALNILRGLHLLRPQSP